MKVCTKCGETKPLDAFHKNSSGKDGRLAFCAECKNKARLKFRVCSKCGEKKELFKHFHRHSGCSHGYRHTCKVCQVAMQRENRHRREEQSSGVWINREFAKAGWIGERA